MGDRRLRQQGRAARREASRLRAARPSGDCVRSPLPRGPARSDPSRRPGVFARAVKIPTQPEMQVGSALHAFRFKRTLFLDGMSIAPSRIPGECPGTASGEERAMRTSRKRSQARHRRMWCTLLLVASLAGAGDARADHNPCEGEPFDRCPGWSEAFDLSALLDADGNMPSRDQLDEWASRSLNDSFPFTELPRPTLPRTERRGCCSAD